MTFTTTETQELLPLYRSLRHLTQETISSECAKKLKAVLSEAVASGHLERNLFGLNPIVHDLHTALIAAREINLRDNSLVAFLLHDAVESRSVSQEQVEKLFGRDVATIVHGLVKTTELYDKNPSIESENFRDLLLSFAEDMRVIFLMIADRVCLMRSIRDTEAREARRKTAQEAAFLYAPLAHKLGLYKLKSELEDLSLKYLEPEVYYDLKEKLNQTKASRDQYIASFIAPVQKRLEQAGLSFSIKGRTKSIHSIYNKMKKQNCEFRFIYDLFAIRIILDSPPEREKSDCWQVYSIVTDMYQPNPKRLRDWLSIPKSNGYESLHITVMGPEGKWVEVQIRTRRMDEIAERGLAAHWRYKGVKSESGLDEWLTSVREALENSKEEDSRTLMDRFKMDLYEDEVFVFTPKGDLFKLPKGSTVLDFAFHIHSRIGCQCIGARINGRNCRIGTRLSSGDQVEILTSSAQTPKQDWLGLVVTGKARTKIRQELKEIAARQAEYAREDLQRKFKNRKIEYDEAVLMRLILRLGYKNVTDFYQALAKGTLDTGNVVDSYLEALHKEQEQEQNVPYRSAELYNTVPAEQFTQESLHKGHKQDVLVIDENLKDIDFHLAKCCNPIYGDEVFGFITSGGGVKIHRTDCPNAPQMRQRSPYRIVPARWAGKGSEGQYLITLRVVGHDDIGIVTNLTSIINKEPGCDLRSIRIDSHDGLFSGQLTLSVSDTHKLQALLRKLQTVRGIKQISR